MKIIKEEGLTVGFELRGEVYSADEFLGYVQTFLIEGMGYKLFKVPSGTFMSWVLEGEGICCDVCESDFSVIPMRNGRNLCIACVWNGTGEEGFPGLGETFEQTTT